MTRTFRMRPKTCRQLEAQRVPYLVPRLFCRGETREKFVSRKAFEEEMARRNISPSRYPQITAARADWNRILQRCNALY